MGFVQLPAVLVIAPWVGINFSWSVSDYKDYLIWERSWSELIWERSWLELIWERSWSDLIWERSWLEMIWERSWSDLIWERSWSELIWERSWSELTRERSWLELGELKSVHIWLDGVHVLWRLLREGHLNTIIVLFWNILLFALLYCFQKIVHLHCFCHFKYFIIWSFY